MRKTGHDDPREDLRQLNKLYADLDAGTIGLPEAIRGMRKVSRLTQQEFAKHRGVSVQSLKQLEQGKGNPTVETLNKLAGVFGLEVGLKPKRRPTTRGTARAAFVLRRSGAQYMFTLQSPDGQALLTSERYKTKRAAASGIEAVKTNSFTERFARKRAVNGSSYFVLKAGNGEVIGTSETFATDADLDNAIATVQKVAAGAESREASETASPDRSST